MTDEQTGSIATTYDVVHVSAQQNRDAVAMVKDGCSRMLTANKLPSAAMVSVNNLVRLQGSPIHKVDIPFLRGERLRIGTIDMYAPHGKLTISGWDGLDESQVLFLVDGLWSEP